MLEGRHFLLCHEFGFFSCSPLSVLCPVSGASVYHLNQFVKQAESAHNLFSGQMPAGACKEHSNRLRDRFKIILRTSIFIDSFSPFSNDTMNAFVLLFSLLLLHLWTSILIIIFPFQRGFCFFVFLTAIYFKFMIS